MFSSLIAWVSTWHIPDSVWGALVALLGVAVVTRYNLWQLLKQQEHASREAAIKRTFEMRQSV
jgi:hypothetical protein